MITITNKQQFKQTDKLILNYFVPFSNGKFIATSLMYSDDVCNMLGTTERQNRLDRSDSWWNIEYSDVDFWWRDPRIDWFNSDDWFDNLTHVARNAIADDKYCFFTCHEDYTVNFLKSEFPNAKIIQVIPDLDLCKRNFKAKRPDDDFSRILPEFNSFNPVRADVTFKQTSIYNDNFLNEVETCANTLGIRLNLDQVIQYRQLYLNNHFMRMVCNMDSDAQ